MSQPPPRLLGPDPSLSPSPSPNQVVTLTPTFTPTLTPTLTPIREREKQRPEAALGAASEFLMLEQMRQELAKRALPRKVLEP